jgi:hypothetical protein
LFEEHEGEPEHLSWPAQSPDLNIIVPLWSVLETRGRNRLPSPTSLKQFEDVPEEEWLKVLLEAVQNLFEPIQRIVTVLKAKGDPTSK